ncbi:DNA repair exonuclease [Methylocystis sp. 9N]|uniref:DNA repair exonuclease n=1 Tax=Methylocystis borbori TaxID=3118750 RepID=A0ABU7XCT0_9HYPH
MFRFLHSSDLHIGKRFGNLPEDLRGRLREARHTALDRLAERARAHGAATLLLAGDTFDTETPTPAILRQALAAMASHDALRWIILPGNHDSLVADELWDEARRALPANVTLAIEATPIVLEAGVVLLPAPCTTRRPGRDLTEWMDQAATTEGDLRIGLAHGAIQSFSEDNGACDVIAPDRAERAGLDYLALGDWHGQLRVGEKTWYSGAPEPDRFKHGKPGQALIVSIGGRGATPEVQPIETGAFDWKTLALDFLGEEDAPALLQALLPPPVRRRQTLLHIVASGRLKIAPRAALAAAVKAVEPDFAHAALDEEALATVCESADLDLIDRSGALRQAADALLAESVDASLPLGEREIARDALARLFAFCEATPQS